MVFDAASSCCLGTVALAQPWYGGVNIATLTDGLHGVDEDEEKETCVFMYF